MGTANTRAILFRRPRAAAQPLHNSPHLVLPVRAMVVVMVMEAVMEAATMGTGTVTMGTETVAGTVTGPTLATATRITMAQRNPEPSP
jgi:hypothetical protein